MSNRAGPHAGLEPEKGINSLVAAAELIGVIATFGDVATYNDIALKVMKENSVAIDDLNAAVAPDIAKLQNPHDVHYNAQGYEVLGQAVVKSLNAALAK